MVLSEESYLLVHLQVISFDVIAHGKVSVRKALFSLLIYFAVCLVRSEIHYKKE
jgi:hypothetical protein